MTPSSQPSGSSSLTAAILIVSTTVSNGQSTDLTAPKLKEVLESQNTPWTVKQYSVVSDTIVSIQQQITAWADSDDAPNLILTSGGTGFAVTDVTPEAVGPLIQKQALGFIHGMMAASLRVTPFAMMSRPVAGVRNKTLIVTLPGSPKGAVENLEAIVMVLPHGCAQAAGANSRELHAGGIKKLEMEAGVVPTVSTPTAASVPVHSCGHGHTHNLFRHTSDSRPMSNDPSLGPSRRHRESPYEMISVERGLDLIDRNLMHLGIVEEELHTDEPFKPLVGAVLAEDVYAREDVPAFRASIVDGYAVVVPPDGKIKGVYPVVSVSHAGSDEPCTLKQGELARITTGAPLPPGANCVIMVEDTVLRSKTEDGKEEKDVEILAEMIREGQNIREVGSDVAEGSLILKKGERISATGGEIGLLASVGTRRVSIYRRPRVAVFSSGNELVYHDDPQGLRHGHVRDSNSPALISIIRSWGYVANAYGTLTDDEKSIEQDLRDAVKENDLVITTGGVSMGELDLIKPTIERAMGGTIHFGRVNMKPGKPSTFSTVTVKDNNGRRVSKGIFSLPGNPASALVTAQLFVLPALERLSGVTGHAGLPRVPVVLDEDLLLDPRPEFHRASVLVGNDGMMRARSTGRQISSRVGSLRAANALLCLPGGTGTLRKGERVDALLMGPLVGL